MGRPDLQPATAAGARQSSPDQTNIPVLSFFVENPSPLVCLERMLGEKITKEK